LLNTARALIDSYCHLESRFDRFADALPAKLFCRMVYF
jgi:hypothetical protein